LKTAATAMASDIKVQTLGVAEKITETVVNMNTVQEVINDWNAMSKKAAKLTIEQYGPPNEATQSRLIWYNNGPWNLFEYRTSSLNLGIFIFDRNRHVRECHSRVGLFRI
jgi:hypothetical protein